MKLKKVAALCNRQGVFRLCDEVSEDGEVVRQWLGDGAAIYPLDGLPLLEEENLLAMFDIPEKKRKKCYIRRSEAPGNLCLDDYDPEEQDYLRLFERRTESGQRYIVAKNGMEIAAAIMPMDTIKMTGFVDKLEQLARMCRVTLNKMEEERRRQEALTAAEAAAEEAQTAIQEDEE